MPYDGRATAQGNVGSSGGFEDQHGVVVKHVCRESDRGIALLDVAEGMAPGGEGAQLSRQLVVRMAGRGDGVGGWLTHDRPIVGTGGRLL